MTDPPSDIVLVDTHVHMHARFRIDRTLHAAWEHFRRASMGWPKSNWTGVLCLTEGAGENAFCRLAEQAAREGERTERGDWTVECTADSNALIVHLSSPGELIVLEGRQCRTKDGIELLLPGRRNGPGPDLPLGEAIETALQDSGPVMIPWGFGKWAGRRGRLVSEAMRGLDSDRVILADSGNRPDFLPEPSLLREARLSGMPVPCGSDPFPFRSEECRAGSYGTVLDHKVLRANPTAGVLRALQNPEAYAGTFGRLEGPIRFFSNQVSMQLQKLRRSTGLQA